MVRIRKYRRRRRRQRQRGRGIVNSYMTLIRNPQLLIKTLEKNLAFMNNLKYLTNKDGPNIFFKKSVINVVILLKICYAGIKSAMTFVLFA